ncbi:fused MFS/spermidine synthase [bacterium]
MSYNLVLSLFYCFRRPSLWGGTLPVLSRAVIRDQKHLGQGIGNLYSINTWGAVLGTFSSGFIFISMHGVMETVIIAMIANFLVAGTALLLSRKTRPSTRFEGEQKVDSSKLKGRTRFIIFIMMGSGFAALSYEVLWNRILVFILTNSVFAFSVMLTTFLVGIALGAAVGARLIDKLRNPMTWLGWLEFGIGISAFLAGILLLQLSSIHDQLFIIKPNTTWWQWNAIRFVEAFIVMFLPTFLMGASFPLAGRLVVSDLKRLGGGIGRLYFFNTLGGVAGSFITGFILIQIIGTSAALTVMVLLNCLLGLLILLWNRMMSSNVWKVLVPGLGILVLILVPLMTPERFSGSAYSHVEKDYPLIDFREGVEGTVTVHESVRPLEKIKRIDVDGLNVAGTSFILQTLQTLQGHVPALLHSGVHDALQIGFGTGQTTHSALHHPYRSYHLVEISKDVLDLAAIHFQEINQNVLTDDRLTISILDGKNYVKYTDATFDIIMNDANYAVATGSASLFTKDHFEACRDRLRSGGILSTWMTIDLAPVDFDVVLKTFQSVFPYCILWMAPNCINKQVVLVGSTESWKLDFKRLEAAFQNPLIQKDMEAINIRSPYDFLDCIILDHRGVASISKSAPLNTDNHPILEFSPRAIRSRDLCAYLNLGKILIRRPDVLSMLTHLPEHPEEKYKVERLLEDHFQASGLLLRGMLASYQGRTAEAFKLFMQGNRLIPDSQLPRYFFEKTDILTRQLIMKATAEPLEGAPRLQLVRHFLGLERFDEALQELNRLTVLFPENGLVHYERARCYIGLSHLDSAEMAVKESQVLKSDWAGPWFLLAEIEYQKSDWENALLHYRKALEYDPRQYESYNAIGEIYKRKRQFDPASTAYEKSLSIMEYQSAVTADLADCYLELNQLQRALPLYQKALSMAPSQASYHFKMGNAYYLSKQYTNAVHSFRQAISLDSDESEYYYNLGNAYINLKNFRQAIDVYQSAVALNPQEPDYFNNLAMSHREVGDMEKSLQIFQEGLQKHPNSPLLKKNYEDTKRKLK